MGRRISKREQAQQRILDEARRDIERMWQEWPERPERSTTFDMRKFYDHLLDEWKALLEYREFGTTDECWQEVKYWLIAYEERCGRTV